MTDKMQNSVRLNDPITLAGFGKRYLQIPTFIDLCTATKLYECSARELEEYARQGWLLPVARITLPESYAQSIWQAQTSGVEIVLDDRFEALYELMQAIHFPTLPSDLLDDFRHPLDKAWGTVSELDKPAEAPLSTWISTTTITPQNIEIPTVELFYHHWQIYRLHWIRKTQANMYRDNAPLRTIVVLKDTDWATLQKTLDATSYFQHLYQEYKHQLFSNLPIDDDYWIALDSPQQIQLEQTTSQYAAQTLQQYNLDEQTVYAGLRIAASMHDAYQTSEHYQLAAELKSDIWRIVELVRWAWGRQTDEISQRIASVGGHVGNYLELLFPNRRREARQMATKILRSFFKPHNPQFPSYTISDQEIEDLLDYVEKSELAWIEYVLTELNTAHFNRNSWSAAETFINLRLLASFPESLMKLLIINDGDAATKQDFQDQSQPGMGTLIDLIFRNTTFLPKYKKLTHWSAKDAPEFATNLSYLAPLVQSASAVDEYLGAVLALATLLRNFTSHITLENEALFRGQYFNCLRTILVAAFATWKTAKKKGWV